MEEKKRRISNKNALIEAGAEEISRYGIAGFSMRHVADKCGVSCAAPAKHFGDKQGFIAAIIKYINRQWKDTQKKIVERYKGDPRRILVESSMAYVDFLVENPHFRTVITINDKDFDSTYHHVRGSVNVITRTYVGRYCRDVQMPKDIMQRKLYVVIALIYGAALMFDNGEMEYNDEMKGYVRDCIDREFDLP